MAKDDLARWAKAARPARARCATCRDARIVELVLEFVRIAQAGETDRSLMAFHEWLVAEQGYALGYAALRAHALGCAGWSRET